MAEKSLFERLDDISAGQAAILNEIAGLKSQVNNSYSRVDNLEKDVQSLKSTNTQTNSGIINETRPILSKQEIIQQFLKQSKKSWRWFGTRGEFAKWKTLAIISLITLLIVGFITTITSIICFKIYSTFTFFENAWMVFGIIYLVYASKTQYTYEVNALASNSSIKYETDEFGMKFPRKEKVVFRVFKWIAIVSVVCNIICIWGGMGKSNQLLATLMELLFLGAIIFAFFMNLNLFAQYSIIWVEGHNLATKEKVVLVSPPGSKQLMLEEEFKKKMPFFY